jgi:ribosome-associated toxin RatA of RatAB toxin-antitoxin module
MYEVISQVENYHKFVPWCQKSHVTKRKERYIEAELVVGFQVLVERYV